MAKIDDLANAQNEIKRLAANQDSKVSNSLFYWVIGVFGAIFVVTVTFFSYILNYEIYRIEKIESKQQVDHDKLIKLETEFAHLMPKKSN